MTKNINEPGDFKRVCTSILGIAFFLTLGSFLIDILVFSRMGAFFGSFGYFCVLTLYYIGWLIVLCFGRGLTVFALLFYFVLFVIFKEYYKYHVYALEPGMIWYTALAGLWAGWANKASVFDGGFWAAFGYLIFELLLVARRSYRNLKQAVVGSVVGIMMLGVGLFFMTGFFQTLYPQLFFAYRHNMVYQITWTQHLLTSNKNKKALDAQIKKGNGDVLVNAMLDEVKLDFSNVKHIFLIQAESLSDRALASDNGKQPMPFLSERTQNGLFVLDAQHHHCLGSANTDFMVMTGRIMNCRENDFMVFDSYPPAIWKTNKTLAHRLGERGYRTAFLHGFDGAYFNRARHYAAMGFEKIIFNENFSTTIERTEWGVDDKTVLEQAAAVAASAGKTFIFIITAGMHPPYDVPSTAPVLYPNADTVVEKYLNAAYVLDNGLKSLYDKAPNNSLFIVYGDHNSPDVEGMDTPFVMYYKGNNPPTFPTKQPGFDETIRYVQSLLD